MPRVIKKNATPVERFMMKYGNEKNHYKFFIAGSPEGLFSEGGLTGSVMMTSAKNITEGRKKFFAVVNTMKKEKRAKKKTRIALFQIVPVRGGGTERQLCAEWNGLAPDHWNDHNRSGIQMPLPGLTRASAPVRINESAPKGTVNSKTNNQKKEGIMPKTIAKKTAAKTTPKTSVTKPKSKVAKEKASVVRKQVVKKAPAKKVAAKKAVAAEKQAFTIEHDFTGSGKDHTTVRQFTNVKAAKTWTEKQVESTLKRGWTVLWEGQVMWVVDKNGNVPSLFNDTAVAVVRKGDHR